MLPQNSCIWSFELRLSSFREMNCRRIFKFMFSTRIMFSIQFHIIVSLEISTWYACSFRLDNFMKMQHRHQYAAIDRIAKLFCTSSDTTSYSQYDSLCTLPINWITRMFIVFFHVYPLGCGSYEHLFAGLWSPSRVWEILMRIGLTETGGGAIRTIFT